MALTGLQPLIPAEGVVQNPEGDPAVIQGGSADPRHADPTLSNVFPWYNYPTPGTGNAPYGIWNQIIGDDDSVDRVASGMPTDDPRADLTPIRHAAPWPTTGVRDSTVWRDPEALVEQGAQSADIHASNMGASREIQYENPLPHYRTMVTEFEGPGTTLLAPVGDQLKSSPPATVGPNTDRIGSFAHQNQYGFDGAHDRDRRLTPGVPGNFMWLRPHSRPMIIEPHGATNDFSGPDSPFTGQDRRKSRRTLGAALKQQATVYTPPLEATDLVVPAPVGGSPSWGSSGVF